MFRVLNEEEKNPDWLLLETEKGTRVNAWAMQHQGKQCSLFLYNILNLLQKTLLPSLVHGKQHQHADSDENILLFHL